MAQPLALTGAPKKPAKPVPFGPTYLDYVRGLIQRGQATDALNVLADTEAGRPVRAEAVHLSAMAHRALGEMDLAWRRLSQADLIKPGFLPARLLHAEMLVSEGDVEAALDLLYDTADLHPTKPRVLQEIAALVRNRDQYGRLRRQWMALRLQGMTAPGGARAVAKAAALIGDFGAANDIYFWLINTELVRIRSDKTANRIRPPKAAEGRVGRGRGERALRDLKALLTQAKTPFFLISGTLLGYIRDGRLLSDDKDLDVGVFRKDYKHAKLMKAFRESPLFDVKRLDDRDRLRVAHVNGVWIDIFPHYPEGDLIWHDGTATRWSNTPFKITSLKVGDEDYAIPDPPERYLDENYGDWRTPNGLFDVRYEAPNVQVLCQKTVELLVYTRVFEGLSSNRWDVVAKYARDFPHLFANQPILERARKEAETITDHLAAVEYAREQGQPLPLFPEAVAARAARAARARKHAPPVRKNPNHVRVAKWFKKRWRRLMMR